MSARDRLASYIGYEQGEDDPRFEQLLNAVEVEARTKALREGADALEARVADDDVDTRATWAGMDAAYLRHLAAASSRTAGDEQPETGPVAAAVERALNAAADVVVGMQTGVDLEADGVRRAIADRLRTMVGSAVQPHCLAEYGGPGYTHCELTAGHDGRHESAIGNMHRATWGGGSR